MTTSANDLSQRLGVPIPPQARILGSDRQNGMDDLFRAKLAIPKDTLAAFLSSTKIPHFDVGDADLLGPDEGYWDPHKASKLRVGDVELTGARFLMLPLDESSPDVAIVYIVNHGT